MIAGIYNPVSGNNTATVAQGKMMKSVVLLFASASTLAMAMPAFAQVAPATTAGGDTAPVPQSLPEANSPQGGAPNSTTPDTGEEGLKDIVVTAQRVSESAQRAPIAISVVRPEDLVQQAVTRPEDLSRVVPALVAASTGGSYTTFVVRGVGNTTVNAYSDPAVAFNYDGVYIGRPSSTSGSFYDLQRVEVLKGPQGTLYGRNATGGAINVIPNRPKLNTLSADAVASYANYDTVTAQGALNVPIGDRGAFRLSGNYAAHDPYYNDGTGGGVLRSGARRGGQGAAGHAVWPQRHRRRDQRPAEAPRAGPAHRRRAVRIWQL